MALKEEYIRQSFSYSSMTLAEAYYLFENGTPKKELICDGDSKRMISYMKYCIQVNKKPTKKVKKY